MQNYLLSKYNSIQSRFTITKFIAVFTCILTSLFLIYYVLFEDNRPILTIPITSRNASTKSIFSSFLPVINREIGEVEYQPNVISKAQKPSCLLVIRTADGAIGNRMFLFASAYGLARLHQCELYVAPWILTDLRSIFLVNLNQTPVHLITRDSVVKEPGLYGRYSSCTLFDDLLRVPLKENLTRYEMVGFYQAYGYFVKYRHEISFLFQFNQGAIRPNVPLVEQLLKGLILIIQIS